jgi:hypothetical protein
MFGRVDLAWLSLADRNFCQANFCQTSIKAI